MKAFYSDHFVLPLPAGHRFPMPKYRLLRDRLAREFPGIGLHAAEPASDGELALVHTPRYIEAIAQGQLSEPEQREIGFPWSPAMVERSRRSVGATIASARAALAEGVSGNLAGGTHHAHADRGSGYCVFSLLAPFSTMSSSNCGSTSFCIVIAVQIPPASRMIISKWAAMELRAIQAIGPVRQSLFFGVNTMRGRALSRSRRSWRLRRQCHQPA